MRSGMAGSQNCFKLSKVRLEIKGGPRANYWRGQLRLSESDEVEAGRDL